MIDARRSRNGVKGRQKSAVASGDVSDVARFKGDAAPLKSSLADQLTGIKPKPTATLRRAQVSADLIERDTHACGLQAKEEVLQEVSAMTISRLKEQCKRYEIPGRSKINTENRLGYEDDVFLARGEEIKKRAQELFAAGASNRSAETEAIVNTEISEGTTVDDGAVKTPDTTEQAVAADEQSAAAEQTPAVDEQQESAPAEAETEDPAEEQVDVSAETDESQEQLEAEEESSYVEPEPLSEDEIVLFRSWMLDRVFKTVLALDLDAVKTTTLPPGVNKQVAVNFAVLLEMVTKRGGDKVKTLLRTLMAKAKQGEEFTAGKAKNVMIKVVNMILNGVQPLIPTSDRPAFRREVAKFIGSRAAFDRADVVREEIAAFEERRSSRTSNRADDALDLLDELGIVEDLDEVVPTAVTIHTGPPPNLGQEYTGVVERYTRHGGVVVRIATNDQGGTRTCVVHAGNLDGGRSPISEHETDEEFTARIEGEFPRGSKHQVLVLQITDGRKPGDKRIAGGIGATPELPANIKVGCRISGVIQRAGKIGHKVSLGDTGIWGWMSRENTERDDGRTPFFTPDDEVLVEIMAVRTVGPQGIPLLRPEPELRLIKVVLQQRDGQSGRFALSVRFTPVVLEFIESSGIELTEDQAACIEQVRQYLGRIEDGRVVDVKQFEVDGEEGFNPNPVISELMDQLDPHEDEENDNVRFAAGQIVRQARQVRYEPTEMALEELDGVDATCLNSLCGHPGPRTLSASGFSMIRPDIPGKLLAVVPEGHAKRDVAEQIAAIAGNKRPTCRDGGNKVLKMVQGILDHDGLTQGAALDDLKKAAGIVGTHLSVYKRLDEITVPVAEEMEPLLEKARSQKFWDDKAKRAAAGGAHH